MNFKLKSLKAKDVDGVDHIVATVETASGASITTTIPAKNIPGLEIVEQDVTRAMKKELREDLRQLNLLDESNKDGQG